MAYTNLKLKKISLLLIIIAAIAPITGCFIYHKPEFKGEILDVDTKQPIKDTVGELNRYAVATSSAVLLF